MCKVVEEVLDMVVMCLICEGSHLYGLRLKLKICVEH